MQMWMDDYLTRTASEYRKRGISQLCGVNRLSDVDVFSKVARVDINASIFLAKSGALNDEVLGHSARCFFNSSVVDSLVLPFLPYAGAPRENEPRPIAIRASEELMHLFIGTRPPRGQSDTVKNAVHSRAGGTPWYIELPHHVLSAGDGVGAVEARAIFLVPYPDGCFGTSLIMTKPGSNRLVAHAAWDDTGDIVLDGFPPGVDQDLLRREVDNLVTLLVLHRSIADGAQRLPVPYLSECEINRNPRRSQALRKKVSIFRVENLTAPPNKFGRKNAAGSSGATWRLGWRTEVRGHFKLQAYGPGQSRRKFIFVSSYERGPEDALHRHAINNLDARGLPIRAAAPTPNEKSVGTESSDSNVGEPTLANAA